MPIPQLTKKIKSPQNWRENNRKHDLKRAHQANLIKNAREFAKKKKFKPIIKLKTLIKLSLSGILFCVVFVFIISRGLPDPGKLMDRQVAQSTKIYDRTGETILYEIHGDEKRTLVSLEEIPDYLKNATIAIEDKNFYNHGGISLWGIFRGVVWQKIRGKKIQGGSTLTQQLVKNAILTSERTIQRKIKEWILAYQIEQKYSKDEILQMYLNEIPYGSTAYGVEAASRKYFNKSVKDITLAEATILAALPQAPSLYSPYGANKDLLINRQHAVLNLMVEQGYISEEEAESAKNEKLEFKELSSNMIAPHFVMYVKEILSEKYGEKMIEQDGLKIYTTLDLYKQKIAEEVIAERGPENEKNYNATNASLLSIDPKTGQILAMVGSRDYFNDEIDGQVNIALRPRQPGSSFKPIVYAASFIQGYTPDTVLYDVVTNFSNDPAKPYEPHNYDSTEHGPVTIRKALAGSLNIPAVKTIYLAGINNVLDLADSLGYSTLKDRGRFGLSLVLGGGEVKLIEHVNAYSAFAREGRLPKIIPILKIEDKDGKILEEFKDNSSAGGGEKVIDAEIARMINDILSDNAARAYVFGEKNWLTLGERPVAAKTGTTNNYRDAWTIGYTPSIVTGVWVGNNDNSEMKRGADGGVVAAPIWHDYMQKVLGDTPIEYFNKPKKIKTGKPVLDGQTEGEIKVKIDRASGLLATEYTPQSFIEEKTFKQAHSILYYIDKNNPRGDAPKNPSSDSQFELWESGVLKWASEQGSSTSTPPTEYDDLHKPENNPTFIIESPGNKETITNPSFEVKINASAPRGINRAEYYINDNLIAVNNSYPFNLNTYLNFLNNGFHNLKVRVCDDIDNCAEKSIEFNLILNETPAAGDINISWQEPKSGQAINNIDFPLSLKVSADNPSQIAKIVFYYSLKGQEPILLTTLQSVNYSSVALWEKAPASGTYKIFAEARGWNGQISKTKEITLIINNIE